MSSRYRYISIDPVTQSAAWVHVHRIRNALVAEHFAANEYRVREMLGRWVSELEPTIVFYENDPVGLTVSGHTDDDGAVRIYVFATSIPWER